MFRLILKRLLLLIPVLIGVTFLVFSILSGHALGAWSG